MTDASKTSFGVISRSAPRELQVFSFLIGKWQGRGKTSLPEGGYAEYPIQWIGRYVLDGTAIADEVHGPAPDGSPYMGMTFRQFDPARKAWVIEYLNVTGSFLRKQVNADAGAVAVNSSDGGKTWNQGPIEMNLERVE